ncbi:hypothetical protein BDR04DRAFT_1101661 [Suillus decipiens]|nr:hypothetical protein BDR04DRAFT_1101661 [Suillus decipiens]
MAFRRKSTHLHDKPAEFWTPELFMDELDSLLVLLGIESDFDLLGHPWGGTLALTMTISPSV